jgi:diguanylate cyclase (GGDEF)-like protein
MTREQASTLLMRGAGTHFDPRIVEMFLRHLPEFEKEIAALELDHHGFTSEECEPRTLVGEGVDKGNGIGELIGRDTGELMWSLSPHNSSFSALATSSSPAYLDQIKNAHREVYALYEIARTFGSSLDIEDTVSVMVNKVGHIVPFDTCAVYLYDEEKSCAIAAHVAGRNTEALRGHCIAFGEGAVGFALANRLPATQFDPMLNFNGVKLTEGTVYKSMTALPLIKDERLLGVLAVYAFEAGRYTDDHARLLETVARLASDALANAMNHAQAESNALTDTLTGLPNARAMYLRFEQEVARARRTQRPFVVVMLDLDDFKLVNDTFGHKTGDQMLREVARILQSQLREYDFLARYAGDEFVAIVQETTEEQVSELVSRIEHSIAQFSLHVRSDKHARVGISVGAASFGAHGETLDQLLVAADEAMYSVKSNHKKQECIPTEQKVVVNLATGGLASTAIN